MSASAMLAVPTLWQAQGTLLRDLAKEWQPLSIMPSRAERSLRESEVIAEPKGPLFA